MAIDVTCECGREFGVTNDSVGQCVKCPECGSWVRVTEALISVEPEVTTNAGQRLGIAAESTDPSKAVDQTSTSSRKPDGSKRAASKSRKSKSARNTAPVENRQSRKAETKETREALRHSDVPLGITWVYYGFLLAVLVGVLEVVTSFASQRNIAPGDLSASSVLSVLALAASFLTIVGKFMCLTAPSQMSGNGRVVLAVLLDAFAVFLCIAGKFMALSPELVMVLMAAIILLPIWGFTSFVMFLRNLGEFLGQRNITEKASGVLSFVRILLIAVLILLLLSLVRAQPLAVLGLGALLIYGIVGSLRYLDLLSACRDALSKG